MKILAIGDLHGKIPKGLPEKDIDLINTRFQADYKKPKGEFVIFSGSN